MFSGCFSCVLTTGSRVFIPVGRAVLALRLLKFRSSRFGIPSDFVSRSFNLISGYMLGGRPDGKTVLVTSSSFLMVPNGLLLSNLMISESLDFGTGEDGFGSSGIGDSTLVAIFGVGSLGCAGFGMDLCCPEKIVKKLREITVIRKWTLLKFHPTVLK